MIDSLTNFINKFNDRVLMLKTDENVFGYDDDYVSFSLILNETEIKVKYANLYLYNLIAKSVIDHNKKIEFRDFNYDYSMYRRRKSRRIKKMKDLTMDKIVNLCKQYGFVFPGSEIYDGFANTWDFGPVGVELKNNIKKAWWKRFVQEDMTTYGVDAAILMNPKCGLHQATLVLLVILKWIVRNVNKGLERIT